MFARVVQQKDKHFWCPILAMRVAHPSQPCFKSLKMKIWPFFPLWELPAQAGFDDLSSTRVKCTNIKQALQSLSKLLRRIQILIPSVSITSQLKCPIITKKPHLTPLKFTVFLANLVLIYSTPANLVKSPNPQFLTALLLYMGQILNPVSNLKCVKPQFKIRMLFKLLVTFTN